MCTLMELTDLFAADANLGVAALELVMSEVCGRPAGLPSHFNIGLIVSVHCTPTRVSFNMS